MKLDIGQLCRFPAIYSIFLSFGKLGAGGGGWCKRRLLGDGGGCKDSGFRPGSAPILAGDLRLRTGNEDGEGGAVD